MKLLPILVLIALCSCSRNGTEAAGASRPGKMPAVSHEEVSKANNQAYEEGRRFAASAPKDEAQLAGRILTHLETSLKLPPKAIKLQVKKGIFYLSGKVRNPVEQMRVEGFVYGVAGSAKKVRSTITVRMERR